ncbi:MAG: hypothetical protein U1C55_05695 [Smithellaceae bacterium]|nr:hypothetical protein [Smithellaceae bacterium]
MGDEDDRHSLAFVQFVQEFKKGRLMSDIQEGGRFIEQDDARPLGQRPGDPHPLPLSAAQALDHPAGKLPGIGHLHGLPHDFHVLRAFEFHPAQVGRTAHEYQLRGAKGEDKRGFLRDHRDELRQFPPLYPADILALDQHTALQRGDDSVQGPEQGGFSRAVGTDDREDLLRFQLKRHLPEDPMIGIAMPHSLDLDGDHQTTFLFIR